jgi:NAD(P)-dependent dehydrogenase (short-subunit alcohol dehydrogenase family)
MSAKVIQWATGVLATHSTEEIAALDADVVSVAGRGRGRGFALRLGHPGVTVLVNGRSNSANAGVGVTGMFHQMSAAEFESVLDVNFMGAVRLAHAAMPMMHAADFGRVVLVSSVGGLVGEAGFAAYGASKAAMIGLGRAVAVERKRCNALTNIVLPNAMTRMTASAEIDASHSGPDRLIARPTRGRLPGLARADPRDGTQCERSQDVVRAGRRLGARPLRQEQYDVRRGLRRDAVS